MEKDRYEKIRKFIDILELIRNYDAEELEIIIKHLQDRAKKLRTEWK